MASPQCEDGYLQIAMELVNKFSSSRFAGQEWQIIWTVWRKTWGWKKKNDRIALSQFAQATGIDRRKCHVLIQNLINRNVLDKSVTYNGDKRIIKYGFNKDFGKWKVSPIKVTVTNKGDRVSPIKTQKVSPIKVITKDSLKDTIKDKDAEVDYSKLQEKTDRICQILSRFFKKFNFYAWRQEQLNKHKHPEGIEECLNIVWEKRKTIKDVRAYITQLMKIKGQNAFERDEIKNHNKRKKEELNYNGNIF